MSTYLPVISVIIPAYKVEQCIKRCIESVLMQTYYRLEIIIINDCSPDNTGIIISNYKKEHLNGKSLKIVNLHENKGLANARNIGIQNASGEYVYHLDGDDWLSYPEAIEDMVKCTGNGSVDIVEADYYIVTRQDKSKKYIDRDYQSKDRLLRDIILKNTSITIWNKLIKTELYKNNQISVPIDISNGEDYITLPRLIYFSKKIVHLDCATYCYNQLNVNSFSNNRKKTENLLMIIKANRFLTEFFKYKEIDEKILERMYFESLSYCLLYSESPASFDKLVRKTDTNKCSLGTFMSMRTMYKIVYLFSKMKLYWMIKLFNRFIAMTK